MNSTGQDGLGRAPAARDENTAHGGIHCEHNTYRGVADKMWGQVAFVFSPSTEHECEIIGMLISVVFSPAANRRASFTMSCPTILDIGYGLDGIFTGCITARSSKHTQREKVYTSNHLIRNKIKDNMEVTNTSSSQQTRYLVGSLHSGGSKFENLQASAEIPNTAS